MRRRRSHPQANSADTCPTCSRPSICPSPLYVQCAQLCGFSHPDSINNAGGVDHLVCGVQVPGLVLQGVIQFQAMMTAGIYLWWFWPESQSSGSDPGIYQHPAYSHIRVVLWMEAAHKGRRETQPSLVVLKFSFCNLLLNLHVYNHPIDK